MVLTHHDRHASTLFRKLLQAKGFDATYRRLGTPIRSGATFTKNVLETATPRVLRGSQETLEVTLGAQNTAEIQREPWEMHVDDVTGPVSPQDELEIGAVVYEVLAAQRDTLGIRWMMATRVKA